MSRGSDVKRLERAIELRAIGATSIDAQRQLFPMRYPQKLD